MSKVEQEFLVAVELHSTEKIRALLDAGLDPRSPIRGKSPIKWLTEMYTRSDKFSDCFRLLLDRGAVLDDPNTKLVLLNDENALAAAIKADPSLLNHRTDMVSAFTPLVGATLLHVAAEFGSLQAARVLIKMGAKVDATAAVDEYGLGGQTALFHTVNNNYGEPILRLLLETGAKSDVQLKGIRWGKGFEWDTTLFDVTPISYAQFGLLPQMHRNERDIYDRVRLLLEASSRTIPPLENIPNRYLKPKN